MRKHPKSTVRVSVIVPIYNAEKYLSACINSIIHQTYSNFEVILIDDGSTDNSLKISKNFASQNHNIVVISKKNGGVSSARNAGLKQARGNYVMFVDSDDIINKDLIKHLVDMSTDVDIVTSDIQPFKDKDTIHTDAMPDSMIMTKILNSKLAIVSMLYQKEITGSPCAKLYSMSVLQGVRFDESITIAEDLLFNFIVMKKAKNIKIASCTGYYYRNNESGAMNSSFSPKRMTGLIATGQILALSRDDELLARAAENRYFMESLFIAFRLPRNKFESSRSKCIAIVRQYRYRILRDGKSRYITRLYALISCLGFRTVTMLARIYSRTRKIARSLH